MLRLRSLNSSPALRSLYRPHRSFVSAVLLSQSWDKLTVTDLKKEARNRGLSSSGNKTSLISRIQEHEKSLSSVAASTVTLTSTTKVSTPPETHPVEGKEGETPGIPLKSQAPAPTPYFLNVALPDLSTIAEPEPAVQIPYTFDNLVTFTPPAESEPEPAMPKMVVIGGEETYGGASPTHNLLDETALIHEEVAARNTIERGKGGLLDDVAEDMGLPHLKDLRKSIFKLF